MLRDKLHGKEMKKKFAQSFLVVRRSPNPEILWKAVSKQPFPKIVENFDNYQPGGELGTWCRAQLPEKLDFDEVVVMSNSPAESGNSQLKLGLRRNMH
jgi:hypothetical protein